MRNYPVPPDMREREKIIGGLLDLSQFIWILIGLGIGAGMFVLTFPLFGKGSIVFGILGIFSGMPFAFYEKHGLSLFEYLKRKRTFDKKTKILENVRNNNDW